MIKVFAQAAAEMEDEKNEPNLTPADAAPNKKQTEETRSGELSAPCWSVVSFEKCVAKNLSYPAAAEKIQELMRQKVAGLCVITDEAAARVKINC